MVKYGTLAFNHMSRNMNNLSSKCKKYNYVIKGEVVVSNLLYPTFSLYMTNNIAHTISPSKITNKTPLYWNIKC